jgi:hypothetical protein
MNRIILVRAKNVGRMLKSIQNAIRMTLYYPSTPAAFIRSNRYQSLEASAVLFAAASCFPIAVSTCA